MQRKDPQYETMKEETVWHMNRLYDYIVEKVLPGHPCELTWDHSTIRVNYKWLNCR